MAKITIQGGERFRPTSTGTPRARQVGKVFGAEAEGIGRLVGTAVDITADAIQKRDRAIDVDYITDSNVKAQTQVQKLRSDLIKDLDDPRGFSEDFAQKADKIYQNFIDNAPSDAARNSLKSNFSGQRASQFKAAFDVENKLIADNILSNSIENVNVLGIDVFDNPSTFADRMQQAELVAEGVDEVLDPKARDIFIENSKKTLTDAYVRGLIDKDLVKAEEVVEGDSLKGFLSPQEILKYRAAVEDAKVRMESATLRKLNEDKEAAVLDRELGIFRGEATQLDLDDDLDRGVYGKEEYLSLSKKLRAEQGTQRATDLSIQDINARQQAGVPFDTTKKSVKDQLDNYFTTIVRPSITEENAEEVIGTFVEQFDYLPSTVKSGLLASLHNGSKQQTTIAATTIDGLIKRDPSIARQFNSTRDLARVRQISSSLSAGMPADLAIQGADNLLVEKGTTEFKERDRAFKDLDREFDQDELTSLFVNDPENVPEGMSRDWNILFREFAVNNKMDFDDARQLAYDITKSTWGISTATGEERYMKHSPENYYNKRGLNPKWIGIQLDSDIKGIKSDITDFDITALPDTIGTDNPGYSVNYLSPEGIPLMLRDEEGRLLIWRPDIEASEDVKKQKQESDDRFIRNRERKLEGQEELLELQRELTPKLAPTGGAV